VTPAAETVLLREDEDLVGFEAYQALAPRAGPKGAVIGLEEAPDVVGERGGCRVRGMELQAVEAHEAGVRADPEIVVAGLEGDGDAGMRRVPSLASQMSWT